MTNIIPSLRLKTDVNLKVLFANLELKLKRVKEVSFLLSFKTIIFPLPEIETAFLATCKMVLGFFEEILKIPPHTFLL